MKEGGSGDSAKERDETKEGEGERTEKRKDRGK